MTRTERERRTVAAMIELYCRRQHLGNDLCPQCSELCAYAFKRIEHCRYLPDKPACSECPTHCYKADMRERIKLVMRFSGPRLLFFHPWLALAHQWDVLRRGTAKL